MYEFTAFCHYLYLGVTHCLYSSSPARPLPVFSMLHTEKLGVAWGRGCRYCTLIRLTVHVLFFMMLGLVPVPDHGQVVWNEN